MFIVKKNKIKNNNNNNVTYLASLTLQRSSCSKKETCARKVNVLLTPTWEAGSALRSLFLWGEGGTKLP